jgi:hypothetical protein
MAVISPRLWTHYCVVLTFPFLVLMRAIRGRREMVLYGISYVLLFLIPVFDLFPFSYHRLLAIVLLYRLYWIICRRGRDQRASLLDRVERFLERAVAGGRGGTIGLTAPSTCTRLVPEVVGEWRRPATGLQFL